MLEPAPIVDDRKDRAVHRWTCEIHARDRRCVFCDSAERLQAHHVFTWAEWPELRTQPGNGLLVCLRCHSHIHRGRLGG